MRLGNVCTLHPEERGRRHNGGNCPVCVKTAKQKYRELNKEKIREGQRRYRAANGDYLREANAAWRQANKHIVRKNNLRRFSFTPELFQSALELQKFCCAICGIDLRDLPQKQVHADHCHETSQPRGVLCHHCNSGLGCFRDNPTHLQRAIEYLKNSTLSLV